MSTLLEELHRTGQAIAADLRQRLEAQIEETGDADQFEATLALLADWDGLSRAYLGEEDA